MKYLFLNYVEARDFPITATCMPASGVLESPSLHTHDFSELALVASGSIIHRTDDGERTLSAGDFFLIHPGGRHEWGKPDAAAVVYNLLYDANVPVPMLMMNDMPLLHEIYPDFKSEDFQPFSGNIYRLPPELLPRLAGIFDQLIEETQRREAGFQAVAISLFTLALLLFARAVPGNEGKPAQWQLSKVFAFLHSNYQRHFSFKELVKHSGMSQSKLYRSFKTAFGLGPAEYLQILRVTRAVRLLKETSSSNDEIAESCGFYNYSHMWRLFRKHLQCSPTDIRSGNVSDLKLQSFMGRIKNNPRLF